MFDDNSEHFGNEDDPFSNFSMPQNKRFQIHQKCFLKQINKSLHQKQHSNLLQNLNGPVGVLNLHNLQIHNLNLQIQLLPSRVGQPRISFPMAGMGETAETSKICLMLQQVTQTRSPFIWMTLQKEITIQVLLSQILLIKSLKGGTLYKGRGVVDQSIHV